MPKQTEDTVMTLTGERIEIDRHEDSTHTGAKPDRDGAHRYTVAVFDEPVKTERGVDLLTVEGHPAALAPGSTFESGGDREKAVTFTRREDGAKVAHVEFGRR